MGHIRSLAEINIYGRLFGRDKIIGIRTNYLEENSVIEVGDDGH